MTTDYTTLEQAHHINKTLVPKHYKGFDSLDHMQRYIGDPSTRFWDRDRLSMSYDMPDWFKTRSMDEALGLMRNGWSEGTEKLNALAVGDTNHFSGRLATKMYKRQGYYPDVARYRARNQRFMVSKGEDFSHKKMYDIVVSSGLSSGVKSKQLFNYGTAVLKVVDHLESLGNRVRLTSVWSSESQGMNVVMETCIKHHEDPVDLNQLAFCLCHPSYLRRMAFAVLESFGYNDEEFTDAYHFTYGSPGRLTPELYVDDVDRVIFKGLDYSTRKAYNTLEGAVKEIRKDLVSNGVDDLEISLDS